MLLERDFSKKDILYLTDFMLAEEAKSKAPYSSFSSKQLQRHLEEASAFINRFTALKLLLGDAAEPLKHLPKPKFLEKYNEYFKGKILPNTAKLGVTDVCYTYLSMSRPAEGDSDWTNSVLTKGQLKEEQKPGYAVDSATGEQVQVSGFIQCTWLKDVWVAPEVWEEIQACLAQIRQVQPKLIVIGGKWSLLFFATLLDGSEGQLTTIARTKTSFKRKIFFGELNKYRASLLKPFNCLQLPECVVIPILNPAFHWVVPDKELIIKKDYERVAGVYRRLRDGESVSSFLEQRQELQILSNKGQAIKTIQDILAIVEKEPTKIGFDVETRRNTIDCIGFGLKGGVKYCLPILYLQDYKNEVVEEAWVYKKIQEQSKWVLETIPIGNTITIPKNFWSIEDEADIVFLLHKLMLHPHCLHIGQNYAYDCKWYSDVWGLNIVAADDTMIKHHVLYNYLQKDLGLLGSMYMPDYTHWKDEKFDKKENYI